MTVPKRGRQLACACAAFACAVSASAPASAAAEADVQGAEFVPGELLVRFDPDVSRAESREIAADLDARVTERIAIVPGLTVVDLPPALGVGEADRLFGGSDGVRNAEPNLIFRIADDVPDDTAFAQLWGLENTGQPIGGAFGLASTLAGTPDADIDAPAAWDVTTGSATVKVAVIDSGITADHPDIAGNLVATGTDEVDFIESDDTPDDENSHGTHVAGTIGAVGDNALGITGVSRSVGLMGLKAGDASGSLPLATIVEAIDYAEAEGVKVVNASFSGSSSPTLASAVAAAPDILFVAAAGNGGSDGIGDDNDATPQSPCNIDLPNVICVAASGQTDNLASFSNFGDKSVDLAAPGTRTLSTIPAFKTPPEFSDDFSAGDFATKWTTAGTNGTWALTGSGPSANIVDSPAGNYLPNADHSARFTNPIDLTAEVDCRVRLSVNRALAVSPPFTPFANTDRLLLEATADDPVTAGSTWTTIGFWTGSGNDPAAIRALEGFDGEATVRLRVRLVSNAADQAGGASVDNVVVECRDPAADAYGFKQGTSMATPQVAGVAALLLADDPTLTVDQLRNTLLASVDPIPSMRCRTFTGGRLNAATALALSPVDIPPATTCPPVTSTVLPSVIAPPKTEPPKKCKKVKKGASAKAKAKAKKKCKKLRAKG